MVSYASGALHFLIVLLVHVVVASTSQSLRMRLERSKPNPKLKNSLKARTNVWPILEIDGSSAAYALNSYFVQQFGAVGYDVYVAIGRSDIEGYLTIDTIGGCTFLVNYNSSLSSTSVDLHMNGSLDASLIWNATGSLFTETMLIDNSTYIPNITMMNTDGVRVQNDFSQFLDGTGGNLGLGQIGCTGDTTGTILDTMVSHGLIESRVYSLWLTQSSCDNLNQYPECATSPIDANGTYGSYGSIIFGAADESLYFTEPGLSALPMQPLPGTTDTSHSLVTWNEFTVTNRSGHVPVTFSPSLTAFVPSQDFSSVPAEVYQAVVDSTGANSTDGRIDCSWINSTDRLTFGFDGANITVPLTSFILANTNGTTAVEPLTCFLGLDNTQTNFSLLGTTFMRHAYLLFDLDNKEIAIGQPATTLRSSSQVVQTIYAGPSDSLVTATATSVANTTSHPASQASTTTTYSISSLDLGAPTTAPTSGPPSAQATSKNTSSTVRADLHVLSLLIAVLIFTIGCSI